MPKITNVALCTEYSTYRNSRGTLLKRLLRIEMHYMPPTTDHSHHAAIFTPHRHQTHLMQAIYSVHRQDMDFLANLKSNSHCLSVLEILWLILCALCDIMTFKFLTLPPANKIWAVLSVRKIKGKIITYRSLQQCAQ